MDYEIIKTGSNGNLTIIDGKIAIDCGVTFKEIKPYYKKLRVVFITHSHS